MKMLIEQTTHAKLIEIAKNVAKDNNWTWHEPCEVTSAAIDGDLVWIIRSNIMKRGQNVRITIKKSDFAVLDAGFLPR